MTAKNLERLLGRIFDDAADIPENLSPSEYAKRKHEFIFHMTDWIDDMEGLAGLFKDPDALDEQAASDLVIGFLYHVIPHLNAAGRLLLTEVRDPCSPDATHE